jgi:hypothetical protein
LIISNLIGWSDSILYLESNARVKFHCQDIGEGIEGSTIEGSTSQKTGFVTLLFTMQSIANDKSLSS